MKRLILIPLILILTACASGKNAGVTPPTNVMSAEPSVVKTLVPEKTQTPIPTTPTENPLVNAPEGFTLYDEAIGMWSRIDAESGKVIFWDAERQVEFSVLFNDDLWDKRPDIEQRIPDTLRLKAYISPKFTNWSALTLTHEENMDDESTRDWTTIFQNILWEKMIARGMIKDKGDFSQDIYYSSGYTRQYNTTEGPQTLTLKHGNGITVHLIDGFDAIKAQSATNFFKEVKGSQNIDAPSMTYMVRITSDKDGNTFVEVVPNISDVASWPEERIMEMLFVGFSNALGNPDNPISIKAAGLSTDLVNNSKDFPYFIFSWAK
jgi:hypothetical protein